MRIRALQTGGCGEPVEHGGLVDEEAARVAVLAHAAFLHHDDLHPPHHRNQPPTAHSVRLDRSKA